MSISFGVNKSVSVVSGLNGLLADAFALYFKTKTFHWHVGGPHFRDYHLLLDEQAAQIIATTDVIAERVRKLGGQTLKGVGQVVRLQRIIDNEAENLAPHAMLTELLRDNSSLASEMRSLHAVCSESGDVATASLIENWIDEAEGRAWFLAEASRGPETGNLYGAEAQLA